MGRNTSIFLTAALLGLVVILSGCAGTARGKSDSVYRHDPSLAVVDLSRSDADTMVVIRYPAMVDEQALQTYFRAFESRAIGGRSKIDDQTRRDTERIAQALIAKSNYYAMSLYRELRDDLPANSVLLSPHLLFEDEQGALTSRPLLASEQIPSVVSIDFNVYSFPDPREMMDSPPLTFGDIVTPLFVVHSNRWLRPSTHGLLLSSEPLVQTAWRQAERQADEQTAGRLANTVPDFSRPLDFVTFLDGAGPDGADVPTRSAAQSRRDVIAVEVHPLEKIRMEAELVSRLNQAGAPDPFAEDFVKGATSRIVTALNAVDHDRATFFDRQAALSRFDPSLGEAVLSRSRSEDIRARLQMAEALVAAEKKFLSAQSESLYAGTFDGTNGMQMRQMITAEYNMLEDRRDLARTQNISTAIAVLALAGAVYAGGDSNSGNFFRSSSFGNLMVLSSVAAVNSAMAKNAQSKTIGENFLVQMAPAINRQVSVQVEWLESRQEITANDFAEFRGKTMGLYQSSVRSMAHAFDPQCEFRHPSTNVSGRWFGLCNEGFGTQSGYGIIIGEDGSSVEFLGDATVGQASGAGAMIVRSPGTTGAVYFEGEFSQGVPDGVVRVEEPGRKPRVRNYRAGRDAGAADANQLPSVQF